MFARLIHKIQFFIAGVIIWIRLGTTFKEAMTSTKEAEKIIWENKDEVYK